MKKSLVLLLVAAAFAMPDVIWTSAPAGTAGLAHAADDFIVSGGDYEVTDITVWILDNGLGSGLDLSFYDDAGGQPGSLVDMISGTYTATDTGVTIWGLTLYEVAINLDNPYPVVDGSTHWFTPEFGGSYYWCAGDHDVQGGSPAHTTSDGGYSWDETPYDCMYTVYGDPLSVIEETTWGQIKTVF